MIYFIFIIIFFLTFNKYNYNYSQIKIKYHDNQYYIINKSNYQKEILIILSFIRKQLIFLIENMNINSTNKIFIERIKKKIYKTQFIENKNKIPKKNSTSYNINKGEKIILCIYNYQITEFYDINTIIYVAIHEIAHIGNKTVGHDNSFYYIFNDLLKEAIRLKIYKFHNYQKIPKQYCGITIRSNL